MARRDPGSPAPWTPWLTGPSCAPALILQPREHGPRLAELYPQGRLVEIADSSTLIPEDQPERLAHVLIDFLIHTGAEPARHVS